VRILHVASFVGNIGDNASHLGLANLLNEFFLNYTVERLEIRKFYKNYQRSDRRYFDQDFITYANKFDLLIIGGGGFLDYWVEDSLTGTTIDLSPDLVRTIEVPTIIASVGCIPHKDVPDGNIEKFRSFLDAVKLNSRVKILLRNDGSVNSINNYIGNRYLDDISEVLDNGFFFDLKDSCSIPFEDSYVAINITNDQLRMNSRCRKNINFNFYQEELVKTIKYLCEYKKLKIVFVPHIYSDLQAISDVLIKLDDYIVREFVSVAPCVQGDLGAKFLFSVYKKSVITIGSRFHANVCSLAMGIPTIGLVSLDRVKYVYDQLAMSRFCVLLDYDFSDDLINIIDTTLRTSTDIKRSLSADLTIRKKLSKRIYFETLSGFGFKIKPD